MEFPLYKSYLETLFYKGNLLQYFGESMRTGFISKILQSLLLTLQGYQPKPSVQNLGLSL